MSARSSTSSQHTPSWSWSLFWSFSKTYPGLIKSYPHSCLDRAQYEDGFLLETLPCFLSASHKRQHDQTLLTTVHSSSKHHKKKLACEGYFLRHLFSRSLSLTRLELDLERLKLSGIPFSLHVTTLFSTSREIRCSILPTSQKQIQIRTAAAECQH